MAQRHFLYIFAALIIISCKKKSCEPEVLPDTVINPTYIGQLNNSLICNVKNGNVDTILDFGGYIFKQLNGQGSMEYFNTIKYNSSTVQFDNLPNFLSKATHSNWIVTSDIVGNFSYVDNTLMPNCLSCSSFSPSVGLSSGFNLNLTGISNTSRIIVDITDAEHINPFSNYSEVYTPSGSSLTANMSSSPSYYEFMMGENVGYDVIVTITLENVYKKETFNEHDTYFTKSTVYRYQTKVVN